MRLENGWIEMQTQPTNWAAFLADLDLVCPKPVDGSLPVAFLDDLEVAYGFARAASVQLSAISTDDLAALADVFDAWRGRYQDRLHQYLKRIHKDDPLLCPVSLFGTMDYGRLETAHTRALAWLLDDKEHGFGFRLLEAVMNHLLKPRTVAGMLVETVKSEYPICFGPDFTSSGRIDVFARGHWHASAKEQAWLLAIEAKIGSDEGENQLSLYDEWLEQFEPDVEIIRLFLTPKGREPSTGSAEWQTLSFLELAGILRHVSGLENKPGYHFLRYYLTGILRDVCGLPIPISPRTKNPYEPVDYLKSALGTVESEVVHGKSR